MKCDNCGKDNANFKYTQIINGVKKEITLCDKCSKEMGIDQIDFNMPISFSSFLDDFFMDNDTFLPSFVDNNILKCDNCQMTFEEFLNQGKFGCEHCYEAFANKIDPILKNIHGGNRHIGRKINAIQNESTKIQKEETQGEEIQEDATLIELNKQLKQAISDENYEEAAVIRDKIKNIKKGE